MTKKVDCFANRLKEVLEEKQMRNIELSRLAEIPPSQVTAYLRGFYQPKQEILTRLSQALNVSELWLLGYDVDKYALKENTVEMSDIRLDARLMMYLDFMSKMSNDERENVYKYIDFVRHNKQ